MSARSWLKKQLGFTLLEMVIVIVLLGITSTTIIQINNGLFSGVNLSRNVQINTQLLQACAERIIASRRFSGYIEKVGYYDGICESLPIGPFGSDRFTVIASPSLGLSCPSGETCQLIEIKVNESIGPVSSINLQLMKY